MNVVNELVAKLREASYAYYNTDKVIMSNDTYDAMISTLRRIDPENSYLKEVGSAPPNNSNKVARVVPMGTLSKYHQDDEVREWLSSESDFVLVSPKYDGFGINLDYLDGKLVMASTRGDGHIGEDVTEAVLKINYVPKEVPSSLKRVRGEAIIPRHNHEIIKSMGYSAMRNAVPGIVRSCREDALSYVDFVAYEFFDGDDNRTDQRVRYYDLFNIENYKRFSSDNFDEISILRDSIGNTIKESTSIYEYDGVVIKTDRIMEDDLSCPKHQIAWKFKSNRRETVLRSIEFQLGATGKFTPIAIFDPVEFQGAQLSRASLGSMDRFYEMKPSVGDMIEVSRRGDIIPYCERVVESVGVFQPLEVCPHCGKPLFNNMCVNKECPEIVFLQIRNFVGTLGIKGIGPSLVKGLIDSRVITRLSDVYKVTDEDILKIPRQGQSAVDKWKQLISKELEAKIFLTAMPFDNIGIKAWESILDRFSIVELFDITVSELSSANIRGLGESKIHDIVNQMKLYKDDIKSMYSMAVVR